MLNIGTLTILSINLFIELIKSFLLHKPNLISFSFVAVIVHICLSEGIKSDHDCFDKNTILFVFTHTNIKN